MNTHLEVASSGKEDAFAMSKSNQAVRIIRGGGGTPDVVFTEKVINGIKVWHADIRDRGLAYSPNPFPLKTPEERAQEKEQK